MSVRLLAIGDIHLGRRPSRIGSGVTPRLDPAELGPEAAWSDAVGVAIEQGVDAVVLAGDVVEQEDDFFEAYGDLERGVRRLERAGIPVLAVAGNHDVQVLPRLADAIPGFRLIGRGGRWESALVEGAGGGRVRVLGWSFPTPRFGSSPLAGAHWPAPDGAPVIGLLHCDRDQRGSRHAPVTTAALAAAGVDAWLLGHVHRPDRLEGERPIGYLGSLTGLDPGEPGAHGPWLVEVRGRADVRARMLPRAPLRWEPVAVPVDDLEDAHGIGEQISGAIRELHRCLEAEGARPRAVGCRLQVRGRTGIGAEIEGRLRAEDPRRAAIPLGDTLYFVEAWRLETSPAVDLAALATGTDPAALLARKLLALERPAHDPERRALTGPARERLARVARQPTYAALGREEPDEAETARRLRAVGLRALERLLGQRGAGS